MRKLLLFAILTMIVVVSAATYYVLNQEIISQEFDKCDINKNGNVDAVEKQICDQGSYFSEPDENNISNQNKEINDNSSISDKESNESEPNELEFDECDLNQDGMISQDEQTWCERCGDGICDQLEQADPNLCPQDCEEEEIIEPEIIGFIGCSITHNAIDGYILGSGGEKMWIMTGDYGGGSIYKWYEQLTSVYGKDYWAIFQGMINKHPSVEKIWWELCSSPEVSSMSYNDMVDILDKIKSIAPNAEIYATSMPEFENPNAFCMQNNGPAIIKGFVDQLVNEGKVTQGPVLSDLSGSQITPDACHATIEGKDIWGQELINFFG